ncbi:ATP synthase mitochondrial F1 complex assembly factor 1 [Hydra vulgaris]|uniref:ATP synthase mitochondrial F1 complex assembly factor 1 n=1 Tax=Hydra vulgaris TaxID=6087 RepID=UPI0001925B3E|nr:ATP synthase mitochondrial F1 complex assembly factor 1 [Hydra vulgaris]
MFRIARAATYFQRYNRNFHLSLTCKSVKSEDNDQLTSNPYFEKYADKIKQVKESGIYTIKKEKQNLQVTKEAAKWSEQIQQLEMSLSKQQQQNAEKAGSKLPGQLDKLMKLNLLEDKSGEEIGKIWNAYFKSADNVTAVIPHTIFDHIMKRKKEYPIFLYPLPKSEGYEFVLSHFTNQNRCFFTSLINYQAHGDNAPWQLSLVYYTEFKESKGIVLMAGEFDVKCMNVLEVQCLVQLQQLFYGTDSPSRLKLLMQFNREPNSFRHMDLIKEMESSDMVVKM